MLRNQIKSKKMPSDLLEEQVKRKELEFEFIKEAFEGGKITLDKPTIKKLPKGVAISNTKSTAKNKLTKDKIHETFESELFKREEKEKLKCLEKLEAQFVKNSKKRLSEIRSNSRQKRVYSSKPSTQSEFQPGPTKLIDTMTIMTDNKTHIAQFDHTNYKFDKKVLDNSQFRKTIKTEKIEIDCDASLKANEEEAKLDEEYLQGLSKEKKNFFLFKTRELYDFLSSVKMVRFIEIFIEDGFEDLAGLLETEADYFQERSFSKFHQEKLLIAIKEKKKLMNDKNNNERKQAIETEKISCEVQGGLDGDQEGELFRQEVENFRKRLAKKKNEMKVDLGTNPDDEDNLLPVNKERNCCWTCMKVILSADGIERTFNEELIKIKVFCSEKCLGDFEFDIYSKCFYCGMNYDKINGNIYEEKYFCGEKCLEDYILTIRSQNSPKDAQDEPNIGTNNNDDKTENEDTDQDIYDPMADF